MPAQVFLEEYLYPHYGIYIMSLIICSLFSFIVFRKKVRSILDPLLFFAICWSLANSVAVFLYFCGAVKHELIAYFIITNLIIATTYFVSYPDKNKTLVVGEKKVSGNIEKFLFAFFYFLFLFLTFYRYSINGIPIFNESRFAINIDNSSGILGMLGRLSDACIGYIYVYSFYLYYNESKRISIFVLLSLVVISFLNGAKGFFLIFIIWFFYYMLFFENKKIRIKRQYLLIVLISPILVIISAGLAGGFDSFFYYAYRILAYGDIYWNAYPNNTLNQVNFASPLANMTYMFWGPFRHIFGFEVSNETMCTGGALVFEKTNFFYPDAGAPNSPISVMSWIYYRWNGILLVCIFFTIISFCLKKIRKMRRTVIGVYIQGSIIQACIFISSDIYLVFNRLFQLSLFLIMLFVISLIFNLIRKK